MKRIIILSVFFTLLSIFFNYCKSPELSSKLKVYVLDGGTLVFNNSLNWFTLGNEYDNYPSKILTNAIFLIEHPKGRLLWDSGLDDKFADRNPSQIDSTAKMVYFVNTKLIDQLKSLNLTPDSINYFAASHTHWDHVGNANYFKKSAWIIDNKEYEWAMSDKQKSNRSYYDSFRISGIIRFESMYDVFEDGRVVIYSTPGHTPGHVSLYVKLEKAQSILISGDLYHFKEQREFKRIPSFNTDSLQTMESMEKFEKLAIQLNARVIIPHEETDYLQLPKYPEYLE